MASGRSFGTTKSASHLTGKPARPIWIPERLTTLLSTLPNGYADQRTVAPRPSDWKSLRIPLCQLWHIHRIKNRESGQTRSNLGTIAFDRATCVQACGYREAWFSTSGVAMKTALHHRYCHLLELSSTVGVGERGGFNHDRSIAWRGNNRGGQSGYG